MAEDRGSMETERRKQHRRMSGSSSCLTFGFAPLLFLFIFLVVFSPISPHRLQVTRKRRVPGTGLLPPSPWLWTMREYVSIPRRTCFCKELALKSQLRPEAPNLVRFMDALVTWWASLEAQTVRNLPVMQETPVLFLCRNVPWRRAWPYTPVFLPGESHGQRSLEGYSPWLCKESDMTKQPALVSG